MIHTYIVSEFLLKNNKSKKNLFVFLLPNLMLEDDDLRVGTLLHNGSESIFHVLVLEFKAKLFGSNR